MAGKSLTPLPLYRIEPKNVILLFAGTTIADTSLRANALYARKGAIR